MIVFSLVLIHTLCDPAVLPPPDSIARCRDVSCCLPGEVARPRAVVSCQRRGAAAHDALVPWTGSRRGGGCCARAPRGADVGDPALHHGRHELPGWPPGGDLPPVAGAAPCRRTAWSCCSHCASRAACSPPPLPKKNSVGRKRFYYKYYESYLRGKSSNPYTTARTATNSSFMIPALRAHQND